MSRLIVIIVAIPVIAFIALFAVDAAYVDSGQDNIVVNETWTPSAGDVTNLSESEIGDAFYGDNETVTVYNSSDVLIEESGNWSWIQDNGTIQTISGGELDGEPSANISYEYQQVDDEQTVFANILGIFFENLEILFYILPAAFLIFIIARVGGAG